MRIATWNVWHRFGPWEARADAILATLRELDADVVCLQETWTEEGGRSQAAELAAALGLADHRDGWRVTYEGITFGNAILSRWPMEHDELRPLTPHPDYEELRSVLGVEIASPIGPVQVFTTHLNFLLHQSAVRQAQVRDVADMMLAWQHRPRTLPPIVTGDFNAVAGSDEMRALMGLADLGRPLALLDAWDLAGSGPGETWASANPLTSDAHEPDRRIDYVLIGSPRETEGRGAPVTCLRFGDRPVDGTWPSDHFGVVADLRD